MWKARVDESQARIKVAGRNINNLRYAEDTHYNAREKRSKESLDEGERGEWKKAGLKLHVHKTKIMASSPIMGLGHGKQMWKKWKQWQILFSWAPKSLHTVTAPMK